MKIMTESERVSLGQDMKRLVELTSELTKLVDAVVKKTEPTVHATLATEHVDCVYREVSLHVDAVTDFLNRQPPREPEPDAAPPAEV